MTFPSSSQTTTQSNLNWLQMEEPSVDFAGFRITFLLKYLSSSFSLDFLLLSPGMVMQLHSFLQEHPEATMEQIDNILDGNLCRYLLSPYLAPLP